VSKIKKILILVGAGLVINFIIQNSYPVSLQFLFWRISMPGILFYPILLSIGFACGWMTRWLWAKKKTL